MARIGLVIAGIGDPGQVDLFLPASTMPATESPCLSGPAKIEASPVSKVNRGGIRTNPS